MNRTTLFIAGAIAGGLLVYAMQNKNARKLAVKALGKGLKLKDEAASMIESLKEGVEDMVAEAARVAEESAIAEADETVAKKPAAKRAPAKKAVAKA